MNDKNKTSEIRELREINYLTEEFKDQAFPTRLKDQARILVGVIDNVETFYLCVDVVPGTGILHLYVPNKNRTKVLINKIKEMYSTHCKPWCKKQGCKHLIVSCPIEDKGTTRFLRDIGFNLEAINLGVIELK